MTNKKSLKDLNLMDRFLFAEVSEDIESLENILSIILDREITLKESPQAEKEQRNKLSAKQVRLDVYAIDENDCVYDTEVQKLNEFNLPERSRYYHSMIDINLLKPGSTDYTELNDVIVIIIASFDIFGKGLYKYTIEKHVAEIPELLYRDGSTTIFLNTSGTDRTGVSDELVSLLRYFENSNREIAEASGSTKIHKLQNKVDTIRNNEEIGVKFMQAWEEIELARRDGLEKGRAEGLEKGRAEGKRQKSRDAAKKLKSAGVSTKIISESLGLSEAEIQKL